MARAEATGTLRASQPLCNPDMLPWWLKDPTGSDIVKEVSAMTRKLEATPPLSPTKDTGREHSPTLFLSLFSGQDRTSHHSNSTEPPQAFRSCTCEQGTGADTRMHRRHPDMPNRTQSASEQSGYDADEEDVQMGDLSTSAKACDMQHPSASRGNSFQRAAHDQTGNTVAAADSQCHTPSHRPEVNPHSPPSSPLATLRTTFSTAAVLEKLPRAMRAKQYARKSAST